MRLSAPLATIIVGVFVAASGCGSSTDGGGPLSEAFCADLEDGYTPFQILGASVKDGTYSPREAADRTYGWAATSCPDQLRTNEALRVYLENWNIDPDA